MICSVINIHQSDLIIFDYLVEYDRQLEKKVSEHFSSFINDFNKVTSDDSVMYLKSPDYK